MTSIAIVGANGQVGSEVSLLLSRLPGVSVIPIVRSRLSSEILERCGIACRVGSLTHDAEARRLLDGCDLIADFSLPTGLPSEAREATRRNAASAMRHAPPGAAYVYISSTMAFGSRSARSYDKCWFARTPYAAIKRYGEHSARRLGQEQGRPTYVLRLGQVFGELQAVSRALLAAATSSDLALLDGAGGHSPSDAVFCSTIARALSNIAAGRERPGTYTLLEAPEWSWRKLYAFHAEQVGVVPRFVDPGAHEHAEPGIGARLEALSSTLMSAAGRQLARHKDLLVAQLLPHHAALEQRMKARHLLRRARAEIIAPARRGIVLHECRRGPVPGRRLPSLLRDPQPLEGEVLAVRELLHQRLGAASHNYR